jgi:small subunit ribosomal protein S4
MHTRGGRRPSNYGAGLAEKQKVKHYYGLGERQLRRYFELVKHRVGNTGQVLLLTCERRLDNVVRRSGFTKTRPQARQGITHGHFRVNGVKVNKPGYLLRPGDVVEVMPRENVRNLYRGVIANQPPDSLDWVAMDSENLNATVLGMPGPADISLPVDANSVVELLSREVSLHALSGCCSGRRSWRLRGGFFGGRRRLGCRDRRSGIAARRYLFVAWLYPQQGAVACRQGDWRSRRVAS